MAVLNHENIVKLEEVYEGENTFYIILEYLKGNSLHDIVTKGILQLGWDEIKSIMMVMIKSNLGIIKCSCLYAFIKHHA